MEVPTIYIVALFMIFIIGAVFGGMAAFLSRRMLINWQRRIAERTAARLLADASVRADTATHASRRQAGNSK